VNEGNWDLKFASAVVMSEAVLEQKLAPSSRLRFTCKLEIRVWKRVLLINLGQLLDRYLLYLLR
jgi:hypothetical protein